MPPKKLRVGDRQRTGTLEFTPGAEPKFLQQFKAKIGHKDAQSQLSDKFASNASDKINSKNPENNLQNKLSEDALHNLEEMPLVVIPQNEDILQSEVDAHFNLKLKEVEDDKADLRDENNFKKAKMIFKKPTKDKDQPENSLKVDGAVIGSSNGKTNMFSSKIKKRSSSDIHNKEAPKLNVGLKKQKLNKQLLSFGDDEEDSDSS